MDGSKCLSDSLCPFPLAAPPAHAPNYYPPSWPHIARDIALLRNARLFIILDERQITHLICARLKYDLYDFFRGCFGPASCSFSCIKGPKTPPEKVI